MSAPSKPDFVRTQRSSGGTSKTNFLTHAVAVSGIIASGFARDGRYQALATVSVAGALLLLLFRHRSAGGANGIVWISAWLAWSALTVTWSGSPTSGVSQVLNLVGWAVIAGLLSRLPGGLPQMATAASHATRVVIVGSLMAPFVFPSDLMWSSGGFAGLFNHRNHLAAFLVLTLPFTWADVLNRRFLSRTFLVLQLLTVIASNSVTGYLLVAVWVGLSLGQGALRRLPRRQRGAVAVAAFALFTMVFLVAPASVVLEGLGRDATLSDRSQLWAETIEQIEDAPLHGYGVGGVWQQPTESPAIDIIRELPAYLIHVRHAHNGFLDVALEQGLIGLVFLVILIAKALRRSSHHMSYGRLRDPSTALSLSVVLAIFSNMTESRFTNSIAIVLIFTLLMVRTGRPRAVESRHRTA